MPTIERLGTITEEERDQIQHIFMRKTALTELMLTLNHRNPQEKTDLYEQIIADLTQATQDMSLWWTGMCRKYNWRPSLTATWHVDFETREVKLMISEAATAAAQK